MGKRKLLVVDDDRVQQMALGIRLRSSGYEVVFASDGVQAVAAVRRERPDLILLDIGLPAGDGYSVLTRLKTMTHTAPVPVIVLSAMDPAVHHNRMLEAGAEAYYQKPADNAALLSTIKCLLGEPEVETEKRAG